MNERLQHRTAQHSVLDVIRMIESAPVIADLVPDVVDNQVLNRIPLAHITIEKSLKYRILQSGGKVEHIHDLHAQLDQLRKSSNDDAEFLDQAFNRAITFYDIDVTAPTHEHFSSLHAYLEAVGRQKDFNQMRYWSLDHKYRPGLSPLVHLPIHVEILYATYSVFFSQTVFRYTLPYRVDEAILDALASERNFSYISGTEQERDLKAYDEWINQHGSLQAVIQDAIRRNFDTGHFSTTNMMRNAVARLGESPDFAAQYFLLKSSAPPQAHS